MFYSVQGQDKEKTGTSKGTRLRQTRWGQNKHKIGPFACRIIEVQQIIIIIVITLLLLLSHNLLQGVLSLFVVLLMTTICE